MPTTIPYYPNKLYVWAVKNHYSFTNKNNRQMKKLKLMVAIAALTANVAFAQDAKTMTPAPPPAKMEKAMPADGMAKAEGKKGKKHHRKHHKKHKKG